MFSFFKVRGDSMLPTFKHGEYIFISKFGKIKSGDAVVAKQPETNKLIIKRIAEIKNQNYFLVGDNSEKSTDSRQFGAVSKREIVGRVWRKI